MAIVSIPKFVAKELKRSTGSYLILVIVLLFQSVLTVALPIPLKKAINSITDFSLLSQMSLLALGIGLSILLMDWIENKLHGRHLSKGLSHIRGQLSFDFLTGRYSFFQSTKTSSLAHKLVADVNHQEFWLKEIWILLGRSIPVLLLILSVLLYINVTLGLIVLSLSLAYFLFARRLTQKVKKLESFYLEEKENLEDVSLQVFSSIALIKSLSFQENMTSFYEKSLSNYELAYKKKELRLARVSTTMNSIRVISRPVVLLFGALAIYRGHMSIGDLFVLSSYLESAQTPLFDISRFLVLLPKARASSQRINKTLQSLEKQRENFSHSHFTPPQSGSKKLLELTDVSIAHLTKNNGTTKKINFKINTNNFYIMTGPSGIGKSSLIRLFNLFEQPSEGSVKFYGLDITKWSLADLRKNVRIVVQDDFLLPMSIYQNLSLERPLTKKHAWEALSKVNGRNFVDAMPEKLNTLIGDGGRTLSGGEKKRLSLARSLIATEDVNLFVFDEPTSGLDPDSSKIVIDTLKNLVHQNCSVIIISHKSDSFIESENSINLKPDGSVLIKEVAK